MAEIFDGNREEAYPDDVLGMVLHNWQRGYHALDNQEGDQTNQEGQIKPGQVVLKAVSENNVAQVNSQKKEAEKGVQVASVKIAEHRKKHD